MQVTTKTDRKSDAVKVERIILKLSFGRHSKNKARKRVPKVWRLPPEVYSGSKYTTAGDVFALGLIFSEICTLRSPFSEIEDKSTNQLQREIAMFNLRPHWKSGEEAFPVLEDIFNLATKMWCEDANSRLTATVVCKRLTTLLENLKTNKQGKTTSKRILTRKSTTTKDQKNASNSEMIETCLRAEKGINYIQSTDVEVLDTEESNKISGSKFHQLKAGHLKGGEYVSMLSVSFRIGKKEKIQKNVKQITNDLKSLASVQSKNLSSFWVLLSSVDICWYHVFDGSRICYTV